MSNLTQLRLTARAIFDEALLAVDAGDAVRRAVRLEGSSLRIVDLEIGLADRPVYAIAIGKAANAMASALDEVLGERLTAAVLSSTAPGGGISAPYFALPGFSRRTPRTKRTKPGRSSSVFRLAGPRQ